MEDKQNICDLLCKTLQATRNHEDLISLTYQKLGNGGETVMVRWEGGSRRINVSMDSGEAMIRDILKYINY